MKILLTGATGFLGKRILRHLSEKHTVVPYAGDILHLSGVGMYDSVVHTVGLNDATCRRDPIGSYNVNVTGTHNLLTSIDDSCKKVIYLSTIHVYGSSCSSLSEDVRPNPQTTYAMSHYLSEEMVLRRPGGVVLRLANGFGCPVDYSRESAWVVVVNSMCKEAIRNGVITVFIGENERRNFVTATDICRSVDHMLECPKDGLFNVGSSQTTRIADMAHRIADRCEALYGFRPEVIVNTRHQNESRIEMLEYRTDKIRSTGFSFTENYNDEIDATLRLIAENAEGGHANRNKSGQLLSEAQA